MGILTSSSNSSLLISSDAPFNLSNSNCKEISAINILHRLSTHNVGTYIDIDVRQYILLYVELEDFPKRYL